MILYLEIIQTEQDREKFEQLYQNYRNLMYYLAFQITKNQEDAEDAVHQAFLYVIENLSKMDNISSTQTKSLLSILAEHRAIDLVRRRRPTYELSAAEQELAISFPNGGGDLTRAMAKLPKRYQDILLLRYDNGYSAHELADMLGMSYAAVRKLIWRAKGALRQLLSEEVADV